MRVFKIVIAVALGAAVLAGCGKPGEREYRSALREFSRGRDVRAKTLLETAVQQRPGSPENAAAYNLLGVVNYRLGDLNQAVAAFENALALDADSEEALYNLGVLYARSGDRVKAVSLLNEAALTDRVKTRAQEYLGSLYLAGGQWEAARQVLGEARERAPQEPAVLTSLALAELGAGHPAEAIALLMEALTARTDFAPALYNLCLIHGERLGDAVQGRAYGERFLEVESEGRRAERVRALLAGEPPPPVDSAIPPAGGTPPETPPGGGTPPPTEGGPRTVSGEELLLKARALGADGQTPEALRLCRMVAEQARREGDEALREKALIAGADTAFDQPEGHVELGLYLLENGRADEARRRINQALALKPDSPAALIAAARAALALKEPDAAIVSLKQALDADPGAADARWLLAELYENELDLKADAAREYRAFARRFTDDPRALKASEKADALDPHAAPPVEPPPRDPTPPAVPPVEPPPAPVVTNAPPVEPVPVPAVPADPSRRRIPWTPSEIRNTQVAVQAFNRGSEYQRKGDLDRALYYYIRAIENDRRFDAAFFNLGMLYRERGDLDLARDAFEHVLAISPDYSAARFNLALVLYGNKLYKDAAEQMKILLRRNPANAQAHYMLGLIYAETPEDYGAARDHFKRYLELKADDPNAPAVRRWIEEHP